MVISSETTYNEMLRSPWQRLRFTKSALTVIAGRAYSSWLQAGVPAPGAAITTAAVPTSATTGAINFGMYNSSGTLRCLQMAFDIANLTTVSGGMITIADRLSHQGGLDSTVTTAQTTNLPTAALTRYTTGVGVMAALEIYTQIGTVATTVAVSYTNTTPTAGQISPAQTIGATGNREASRFIMIPLVTGDRGITSVENVDLVASTTTAGAFGVTLYMPLVSIPIDHLLALRFDPEALYGFGTWFPEILDDACLMWVHHMATTTTGIIQGEHRLHEDA